MNLQANEMKLSTWLALYLRLSKDEYILAVKYAAVSGRKLRDLVKDSYFQHQAPVAAFQSKGDCLTLMIAIGRMGNYINQIIKFFNSGGKTRGNGEI